MTPLEAEIRRRIRRDGPLPLAAYVECALYHPELGYYARADRRSGRAGDFFTSVDLGPLFGELLAAQFAEMWRALAASGRAERRFALVEAAAGSGRLARDVLDAAARDDPAFYDAVELHLVERSRTARGAQAGVLGPHAPRLASSGGGVPEGLTGVIFANELLDALPPHVLVMTGDGLREVHVDVDAEGGLVERLGPLSGARVREHVTACGMHLEPGWRVEICPAAGDWVRGAARALARGFLLLIDYGHEAHQLYSPSHAAGTLTAYRRHRTLTGADGGTPPWLVDPGERDITAHVDLTAVRRAAEGEGLRTLGVLDQTYFLLGLGAADRVAAGGGVAGLRRRLALKSLLVPGGLGSTHKVLVFGKGVGAPRLSGCSYATRAT